MGRKVCLSKCAVQEFCPVRWGKTIRLQQGVGVFQHEDGSKVSAYQLLMVLRKALRELGIDAEGYGTHSFRIGAATEVEQKGWRREAIMEMGRWASDCYTGYLRADREERETS